MSQRTDRVDELLREEIGAILARDVQDPRIGFATITDVETTPDLRHARVWVSVIGGDADRAETLAALERAMGFVRHELGRRLRIRRIPELHVRLDDSSERGTRVLRLLSELGEGHVPGDLPKGETLPTPVRRIRRPGDAEEPLQPEAATPGGEGDAGSRPDPRKAHPGGRRATDGGDVGGRGPSGGRAGGRATAARGGRPDRGAGPRRQPGPGKGR